MPVLQESLLSSSNSYEYSPSITNPTNVNPESFELITLKSSEQSFINRKDSNNSYEYNQKYSTKL